MKQACKIAEEGQWHVRVVEVEKERLKDYRVALPSYGDRFEKTKKIDEDLLR